MDELPRSHHVALQLYRPFSKIKKNTSKAYDFNNLLKNNSFTSAWLFVESAIRNGGLDVGGLKVEASGTDECDFPADFEEVSQECAKSKYISYAIDPTLILFKLESANG